MLKYSNRTVTFGVRIIKCLDNQSLDNPRTHCIYFQLNPVTFITAAAKFDVATINNLKGHILEVFALRS